jgi:hypothetical protein
MARDRADTTMHGKSGRVRLAGLRLLSALLVLGTPRAEDAPPAIDCAETDLAFAVPGYTVKCSDLSKNALNVGESFAAARAHKLMAESNTEGAFLMVMDIRPLGNIYLKRRSLSADVEDYFSGGAFRDWKADSTRSGFEVETFTGESNGGEALNCIGFRRQGARRYSGLGRLVIGMACTYGDRERVLDALKQLTTPGG